MENQPGAAKPAKTKITSTPCIGTDVLRRIVLSALGSHGRMYYIWHCKEHMRTRNFDMNDVIEILTNGDYERYDAEWREDHENWLYFVVGEDLEGERLKIIFSVEDADSKIRLVGGERYHRGKQV